ncbi:MAG: thioesterase family protein [Fuerstiella sp.]
MTSCFEVSRRVEFCETDMAGIVHFSNFYRWMEQVEHAYFRSLDLTIVNHQPDGQTFGWPRVSCSCRFEAPARYNDVLTVKLYVQRIGVKSLTFEVHIFNGDVRLAKGIMKTVCCVVTKGQPLQSVEIPAEYLEGITEYQGQIPA